MFSKFAQEVGGRGLCSVARVGAEGAELEFSVLLHRGNSSTVTVCHVAGLESIETILCFGRC